MTKQQLDKYFDKINAKKDELIRAQILNDKKWADCVRKEIDLLMDMCFKDDDGKFLILGD